MEELLGRFKFLTKNSDLAVAVSLFLVLGVMIIPIPPFLLDILLAITLSVGVVILLVSVYTKKPLDFLTFPSVLLMRFQFSSFTTAFKKLLFTLIELFEFWPDTVKYASESQSVL